jgi:hypothetical protein
VFNFSTGAPDGRIATATRPPSAGKIETETADDFLLTQSTTLKSATFIGLVTGGESVTFPRVSVDIYRVFPNESDATRTINVPTRANSPGDVELVGRDTIDNDMSFTTTELSDNFSASNSILNGITGLPNPKTGGEGAVSGREVQFNVTFTSPLNLPADHYFFRPEVEATGGEFFWLSAAKPIGADGTPFLPDLQSWIRNTNIAPDWVRVGTDVVGADATTGVAPTFNAAFTLTGETNAQAIPLPGALIPAVMTMCGLGAAKWRRRQQTA